MSNYDEAEYEEFNEDVKILGADEINDEKKEDFYRNLRTKINKYVDTHPNSKYLQYLVLVPDVFHLLCKLLADKDVSAKDKTVLGLAIAYFVSPVDLIPDALIGLGQMDDLAIAAFALNGMLNNTDREVIMRHWAGDGDVFEQLSAVLDFVSKILGKKGFGKIKDIFQKHLDE